MDKDYLDLRVSLPINLDERRGRSLRQRFRCYEVTGLRSSGDFRDDIDGHWPTFALCARRSCQKSSKSASGSLKNSRMLKQAATPFPSTKHYCPPGLDLFGTALEPSGMRRLRYRNGHAWLSRFLARGGSLSWPLAARTSECLARSQNV